MSRGRAGRSGLTRPPNKPPIFGSTASHKDETSYISGGFVKAECYVIIVVVVGVGGSTVD